ncbi:MAG: 2,3-bisphosphoglycerate-independent phosphoglycerate mutase, partial [Chloroflexi bacterium]|nr:2,3-bisphosphoglycerate-independent phosphoglycerate mutase [Chloroflexota bacterium]
MNNQALLTSLAKSTPSKIILCVLDGLGGLPHPDTGKSELRTARTPNLDKIVSGGVCGLMDTVGMGITPGSAPGHLGLFGYDPLKWTIGRGVLEALGIDFPLQDGDIAIRGNFCTLNDDGYITDRRAGRLATDTNKELCLKLNGRGYEGVKIIVMPVKDHRFVIVLRGQDLSANITETDPQTINTYPLTPTALDGTSDKTVRVLQAFLADAKNILKDQSPANFFLMRGYASMPHLPSMEEMYRLKSAAVACYPMYRGLAKAVGMTAVNTGKTYTEQVATVQQIYNDYDFIFLHAKATDACGEDGDFKAKVKAIEEIDKALTGIIALNPDVLVVTADHATPAVMASHSWHAVPVALKAKYCYRDDVKTFDE